MLKTDAVLGTLKTLNFKVLLFISLKKYQLNRFDEETGKVELDYPRDMSMWRGIGYNIDTVFQWKDGKITM